MLNKLTNAVTRSKSTLSKMATEFKHPPLSKSKVSLKLCKNTMKT